MSSLKNDIVFIMTPMAGQIMEQAGNIVERTGVAGLVRFYSDFLDPTVLIGQTIGLCRVAVS